MIEDLTVAMKVLSMEVKFISSSTITLEIILKAVNLLILIICIPPTTVKREMLWLSQKLT